ncbi:PBSX family phage terminase large subunit [Acrocarpospora macrocephala]|uniref:Phage terminase large subunit n=1 Tax=Acrocarpospora macrocephala TaxID=150177 RepID=A0A5M3WF47_9ACTN|nr:terminase family protein [Acrocarpospora macrocephala]GES07426.1 phage terminase large subunit [Acrocarpospora macrocephala]
MQGVDLRLSEKQEESIAHATARICIWEGSVRSGKTVASLLRWLVYVASAPRGGQLVVIGKTFDTVWRNVFGPLMDPAITGPAARLISYTRGAPTAKILGRSIEIITANDKAAVGRLRGGTFAGAYVDEATLIPEGFWDMLLSRLSVRGAQLFATTNPDSPAHWLRKRFLLRKGELNLRSFKFVIDDNHALDPGYVASLKMEYVGLWYRRFIKGEWVAAEGAVYDMWDEDVHVVDIVPQITQWIALGVDHGTTNPFHAGLLGLGIDRRLYIVRDWRYDSKLKHRQLTDVEYSKRLRTWLDQVPIPGSDAKGVRPMFTVVDPSAASFRVQLHEDGIASVLGDNEVLPGIMTVSSLLATQRLKVHSSCKDLIEEFPGYSWDDKKSAKGEDAPIKIADHGLDMARYAAHTTRATWQYQLCEPQLLVAA